MPERDTSGYSRRDRVKIALARFLFPGHAVDRGAMADAVLTALDHGDDFADYLPARGAVPLAPLPQRAEDAAEAARLRAGLTALRDGNVYGYDSAEHMAAAILDGIWS